MTHVQTNRRSEQGFTLVELAIVMVIIGLLIGGILKGQELIANARISATVTQIKGLDAALNTFQDKYNVLPGEVTTPANRLPGCAAAPCNTAPTTVNGRFDNLVTAAPAGEGVVAFAQLNASDLISGVDSTAAAGVTFGGQLPAIRAGGGMWLASTNAAGAAPGGFDAAAVGRANTNYAVLNGTPAAIAAGTGGYTPTAAAQIDRKVDDGLPNAGIMLSGCNNGGNAGGAAGAYVESVTGGVCSSIVRVLN